MSLLNKFIKDSREKTSKYEVTHLTQTDKKPDTTLGSHDLFPPLALLWGFLPGAPG